MKVCWGAQAESKEIRTIRPQVTGQTLLIRSPDVLARPDPELASAKFHLLCRACLPVRKDFLGLFEQETFTEAGMQNKLDLSPSFLIID